MNLAEWSVAKRAAFLERLVELDAYKDGTMRLKDWNFLLLTMCRKDLGFVIPEKYVAHAFASCDVDLSRSLYTSMDKSRSIGYIL